MKVSNNRPSTISQANTLGRSEAQRIGSLSGMKVKASRTPAERPTQRPASALVCMHCLSGKPVVASGKVSAARTAAQQRAAQAELSSAGIDSLRRTSSVNRSQRPALREGDRGVAVKQMQSQLNRIGFKPGPRDGIFGPRTEAALKRFQRSRGLEPTGRFNEKTNAALERAATLKLPKGVMLREGSRGPAVKQLQKALAGRGFNPGPKDGMFGPRTEAALKRFQRSRGISADGVYGPQTRSAFARGPAGSGGGGSVRGGGGVDRPSRPDRNGNGFVNYAGRSISDGTLRGKLNRIADYFGRGITITSGDRNFVPPGGSRTSLHLAGRAADLHVNGLSDRAVFYGLKRSGLLRGGYEVIWHGSNTATGGPHIHIGRYGDGRASTFRAEGVPGLAPRGVYLNA